MKGSTLSNPNGGFVPSTTFVSGVDRDGTPIEYGCLYQEYRANSVIRKGHGVSWVNPTASVPVSVAAMPTAATDTDFAGVALDGATAAGQYIRVVTFGFCLIWMNAQTSAGGEVILNPTTTAGELIRAADPTHDATLVAGSILGRCFGIKDATTNLALCFIRQA